jgi:DNA-binding response OmpR family regulator
MGDGPSNDDENLPSVLIVEDEEPIAQLYEQVLSRDYEVTSVHNGGKALTQIDESVDIVILDRRLPGMSGDEILDQISSQDLNCRVAMVSAVDPDFDVIEMGFDDYLVKPVENAELVDTVDRLIALNEYEELYQELSSKLVKKNIIQVEKTEKELDKHDEYQALVSRIEDLESQLDTIEADQEFDDRLLPS